mgnify:CR=1 FL=1
MPTDDVKVLIHLENMKVNVDGRVYENPHVIVVGASQLSGEVAPGAVRLDARFDGYPKVELAEDALKISSGGDFMADVAGTGVLGVTEQEEGYVIEGSRVTVRFEVDEQAEKVAVKVPRVGVIKSERLVLGLEGEASINLMLSPFVIGALTIGGPVKLKVTVSADKVSLSTGEGQGERKEVQLQRAAAERASS